MIKSFVKLIEIWWKYLSFSSKLTCVSICFCSWWFINKNWFLRILLRSFNLNIINLNSVNRPLFVIRFRLRFFDVINVSVIYIMNLGNLLSDINILLIDFMRCLWSQKRTIIFNWCINIQICRIKVILNFISIHILVNLSGGPFIHWILIKYFYIFVYFLSLLNCVFSIQI
jgi:hypothetical protein